METLPTPASQTTVEVAARLFSFGSPRQAVATFDNGEGALKQKEDIWCSAASRPGVFERSTCDENSNLTLARPGASFEAPQRHLLGALEPDETQHEAVSFSLQARSPGSLLAALSVQIKQLQC